LMLFFIGIVSVIDKRNYLVPCLDMRSVGVRRRRVVTAAPFAGQKPVTTIVAVRGDRLVAIEQAVQRRSFDEVMEPPFSARTPHTDCMCASAGPRARFATVTPCVDETLGISFHNLLGHDATPIFSAAITGFPSPTMVTGTYCIGCSTSPSRTSLTVPEQVNVLAAVDMVRFMNSSTTAFLDQSAPMA